MWIRNTFVQMGAFALAATLGAGVPLASQNAAASNPRIVLINGERVTTETEIGRQVRERFQNAAADWQSRIKTAQTELQTLTQNRQQQQLTLSADALARLNSDIEEKQVALQRLQDDARRALDRVQAKGTEDVNAVLIPALESLAHERGYDLVFDSRMTQTGSLLYFSNALDITDEFIARVNQSSASKGNSAPND